MIAIDRFEHLIAPPDLSVREVLRRIELASPNLFQIIVGPDGVVLGTITDGDIRRSVLAGISIDDPVRLMMNPKPRLGYTDAPESHRSLLRGSFFLPIVKRDNRLVRVLVGHRGDIGFRRALVMAGGFGTRLGPLTKTIPKPLLDVGGRPMLDRVLGKLEAAGISEIHVAVHYLADQIETFLAARPSTATIRLIKEERPLGTAGALGRMQSGGDEPVLVINADVESDVNLDALLRFHDRHAYDGTIAVSCHEVTVPFGVVRYTDDGLFSEITEKPTYNYFVSAGIYLLSPEIVALVRGDAPIQMPELLNMAKLRGLKIGIFPLHEYWLDVGRPDDLRQAREGAELRGQRQEEAP